jgi:hypothetical protein
VITLAVADTSSYPFWPYADLYTSTGGLVGTITYGHGEQYTLPATGTYVIRVYDYGFDAAGDYNFTPPWTSPLKGCIAGQKFNDLDGDGVKESGEEGLQGWTVFLDANNNGALDSGERRTVTDIDNEVSGGPWQIVSDAAASYGAPAGAAVQFPVWYTTSDLDATLTGVGLRMHFDSSKLVFNQLRNVLTAGFVQQQAPVDDAQNFDNDPSTDKFVLVSWLDLSGQWPNQVLPAKLFDAGFTLQAGLADGTATNVNFSASSKAAGYDFESRPITVTVVACNLDVDGNCQADALTDGLLILRYLFGFRGTALVEDALAADATRTDPAQIAAAHALRFVETHVQPAHECPDHGVHCPTGARG